MKINVLVFVLLAITSTTAFSAINKDNFFLKYYITVNNIQEKGLLIIDKKGETYRSNYYGVISDDKIPFYAKTKNGQYVNGIFSTKIKLGDESYSIDYDPKNLANKSKLISGRAIIYNDKTGKPELYIEKIPTVTMENILLGFLSGHIKPGEKMIFFDNSKSSGIRIYFEKAAGATASALRREDGTEVWICKRTNVQGQADVPLFNVVLNSSGIPLAVSANSGRWELKLAALRSRFETITENLKSELENLGRKELQAKLPHGVVSHVTAEVSRGNVIYDYALSTTVGQGMSPGVMAAKMVRAAGKNSGSFGASYDVGYDRGGASFERFGGDYGFDITRDEVCSEFKKQYTGERRTVSDDCRTIKVFENKSYSALDVGAAAFPGANGKFSFNDPMMTGPKIIWKKPDGEESLSLEEGVTAYLKSQPGGEQGTLTSVKYKNEQYVSATIMLEKPVSRDEMSSMARKVAASRSGTILREYGGRPDPTIAKYLSPSGEGYRFRVPGGEVEKYMQTVKVQECNRFANTLSAYHPRFELKNDSCSVSGKYDRPVAEYYKKVKKEIYTEYPDLQKMGIDVNPKDMRISFEYLRGFDQGVNNVKY